MADLLRPADLPHGFAYPREFVRVVELGIVDLEPWRILAGERLARRATGVRDRYPSRVLVPFAERIDNDDVACWDVDRGAPVVIVHDLASPGWEHVAEFADFYDWLRQAVEDLIEYDEEYWPPAHGRSVEKLR
ncbi:hypothetical protein [Myceligenerans pegani]|uniref:SMI1/KNR4 family protein n=1 Tax=Myceligenerans pegani TaxID=2776917 RepID=A0ABR9MZ08_9MICO|nr:hypothetical protein [Myceligenerans sp. TRM 65318]MBE1876627.1 hypothetical protein [Myceligenerans sp. TRM 65318]MBE3018898.1 hypothetical protein [Myceligenerans sp. TRM 65318]